MQLFLFALQTQSPFGVQNGSRVRLEFTMWTLKLSGVLLFDYYYDLPGRGMCMPGKGTLKGGTMTGGKAGRAAVGWATL